MSFPGPQKNKIEFFVFTIYQEHAGKKLSKRQIMPQVERFEFAPDLQKFFEELPDREYDDRGLIEELNQIIERHGRTEAVGGCLEPRHEIPLEWKRYAEKHFGKEYARA